MDREAGFEPTTTAFRAQHSTIELLSNNLVRATGFEPAIKGWKPYVLATTLRSHIGARYRIRTDITNLRGWCPSHWTKQAKDNVPSFQEA